MRYALIAETVAIGPTSTITAENILDAIVVKGFPVAHPLLYLLVRLMAPTSAGPAHQLEVRVVNDDGDPVGAAPAVPFAMASPAPGYPLYSTQVVRIPQPIFYREGEYTFEVFVDGIRLGGAVLGVLQAGSAAAASAPQVPPRLNLDRGAPMRARIARIFKDIARWVDPQSR